MRIVGIIQGKFGQRFVDHLQKTAPESWQTAGYDYRGILPAVIDDPHEILPKDLPEADLLLYLGQKNKLAELIADIAEVCKVKAVIAPVDNRTLLPTGLANQTRRQLLKMGIDIVFPDPFCALTEEDSENPIIKEFARYFGKPRVEVGLSEGQIDGVSLIREAPCGNTHYVAERLSGVNVKDALEKAGQLHREHPCMASMNMDREIGDTLMKKAGALLEKTLVEAMESAV